MKKGFNTKNRCLLTNALEQEIEIFQRHLVILKMVLTHEPVGIHGLSSITNLPIHKVRYSLGALEKCGLIKATVKGAVTTWKPKSFLPELQEGINNAVRTLMNFNHTFKSIDWRRGAVK